MFWSFHPLADKTNNEHLPKPFFKVIRKSLYLQLHSKYGVVWNPRPAVSEKEKLIINLRRNQTRDSGDGICKHDTFSHTILVKKRRQPNSYLQELFPNLFPYRKILGREPPGKQLLICVSMQLLHTFFIYFFLFSRGFTQQIFERYLTKQWKL